MKDEYSLPVVDLTDFRLARDQSARKAVATALVSAMRDVGFVYITGHDIPEDRVSEMFHWSKTFFDLPESAKMLAPHPVDGAHHRGYSAVGREKVTSQIFDKVAVGQLRAGAPDVKESFEAGRENNPGMENIWIPEDILPGFRQGCMGFYWICDAFVKTLLNAVALGLGVDETYFVPYHDQSDNQLRLLHYPSVSVDELAKGEKARIGAHTDYDSLTLLFQDEAGGLEVEDPHNPGTFKPVLPLPGSIVVNTGDFLMQWSNDVLKSTVHRVSAPVTTTGTMAPERYSIPYFCGPNREMQVSTIPSCISPEHPKKYPEPISIQEYVQKRAKSSY